MRRTVIFAGIYTLIITLPALAALAVPFHRSGELRAFVDAMLTDRRWPVFPIVLFWPWIAVVWSFREQKKHA